jgi:uncharacterized membrane protein YeaQ/YmgE (transglycosylase-associated protein family)
VPRAIIIESFEVDAEYRVAGIGKSAIPAQCPRRARRATASRACDGCLPIAVMRGTVLVISDREGCTMFNIIGWIIVGFISGALARWFYPGAIEMGWIMTTVLGIAGSFAGGFIGSLFTKAKDMGQLNKAGFVMSIIGAMVLIFIAHRLGIR